MDSALLLTVAGVLVVAIVVAGVGAAVLLTRRSIAKGANPGALPNREADLSIDVAALTTAAPNEHSGLAFYGAPVRIAVLVVAPTGRGRLPDAEGIGPLLEHWLPDIQRIASADQPIFQRWPEQLSVQGFQHAFFHHCSLPGSRGKGTVWCSAAGPFLCDDRRYLVGVICRTAQPNSLSEVAVTRDSQWLEILRPR